MPDDRRQRLARRLAKSDHPDADTLADAIDRILDAMDTRRPVVVAGRTDGRRAWIDVVEKP